MDKTPCRTPAGSSATNIPSWKYDCVSKAVQATLADGPRPASELVEAVRERLDKAELDDLGALGWHVTTVRLEMEVRGEITRDPDKKPLTLLLEASGGDI